MIRLAREQRVEICAERGDSLLRARHRRRNRSRVHRLERRGELLQLLVEAGGRAEADHREGARRLVQVRQHVLDRRAVGRARGELVEALARLVERVVDLGLDPAQRAKIEVGGIGCHYCLGVAL